MKLFPLLQVLGFGFGRAELDLDGAQAFELVSGGLEEAAGCNDLNGAQISGHAQCVSQCSIEVDLCGR